MEKASSSDALVVLVIVPVTLIESEAAGFTKNSSDTAALEMNSCAIFIELTLAGVLGKNALVAWTNWLVAAAVLRARNVQYQPHLARPWFERISQYKSQMPR